MTNKQAINVYVLYASNGNKRWYM